MSLTYWIFTKEELELIHQQRLKVFVEEIEPETTEELDDRILENFYLKNVIKLCRKRKGSQANELPFLIEKVTESAVHIFKRYYLVNTFVDSSPEQNVFIAVYLAWKLEEMSEKNILTACQRMKSKESSPKAILHYGSEGYTELEMNFLQGINFQINKISMIRPIEALIIRIEKNHKPLNKQERFQMQQLIDKVYFHEMFWTVHPAKLALCIGLIMVQKLNQSRDIIDKDGDLLQVINDNHEQIQNLIKQLKELKRYEHKDKRIIQDVQKYQKLTRKFRKPTLKRMTTMNNINVLPNSE